MAAIKNDDASQIVEAIHVRNSKELDAVEVYARFLLAEHRLANAAARRLNDLHGAVDGVPSNDAQLDENMRILAQAKVIQTGDAAQLDFTLPAGQQTLYTRRSGGVWRVDLGKTCADLNHMTWNGQDDKRPRDNEAFHINIWLHMAIADGLNQVAADIESGKIKTLQEARDATQKAERDAGAREAYLLGQSSAANFGLVNPSSPYDPPIHTPGNY